MPFLDAVEVRAKMMRDYGLDLDLERAEFEA
jgi:hypothetical protein